MNQQQTTELFQRCEAERAKARVEALEAGKSEDDAEKVAHEAAKDTWNTWATAIQSERDLLKQRHRWQVSRFGEPLNEATQRWQEAATADFSGVRFEAGHPGRRAEPQLEEASAGNNESAKSISVENGSIRFDGFDFPGDASFEKVQFSRDARFERARFFGNAYFKEAQFSGCAGFGKVEFARKVGFEKALFLREARFAIAQFGDRATFVEVQFSGKAGFDKAQFRAGARFDKAQFSGGAWFGGTQFSDFAAFEKAQFSSDTWFGEAQFLGFAGFGEARFSGYARFEKATFSRSAGFEKAQFSSDAEFRDVQFSGDAHFKDAQFSGDARFQGAQFFGGTRFDDAQFSREAAFWSTQFSGDVGFERARFSGPTSFLMAKFVDYATFAEASFRLSANFSAIRGERGFSLADVTFDEIPDFIQAHFEEAPRLDSIKVFPEGDETTPKYRALKRLAVQGHDHVREHMFFKGELLSRLTNKEDNWAIRAAILVYGWLSDFGVSYVFPLFIWAVLSFAVSPGIYYYTSSPRPECSNLDALGHSYYLAAKHGLVLLGNAKDQRVTDAYLCLYGKRTCNPPAVPDPALPRPRPIMKDNPAIPWWITLMEFAHSVLSVILLFLVALGIRNQFRIK